MNRLKHKLLTVIKEVEVLFESMVDPEETVEEVEETVEEVEETVVEPVVEPVVRKSRIILSDKPQVWKPRDKPQDEPQDEPRKKMKFFFEEITQWDQDRITQGKWGDSIVALIKTFRRKVYEFQEKNDMAEAALRKELYHLVLYWIENYPEEMVEWKRLTRQKYFEP